MALRSRHLVAFLLLSATAASVSASAVPGGGATASPPPHAVFVQNAGQWQADVLYVAVVGAGRLVFRSGSVEYIPSASVASARGRMQDAARPALLTFDHPDPSCTLSPVDGVRGVVHFYGASPAESSFVNVPCYGSIVYRTLWDGVDLLYRLEDGVLHWRFVFRDSAARSRVTLRCDGDTSTWRARPPGDAGIWDPRVWDAAGTGVRALLASPGDRGDGSGPPGQVGSTYVLRDTYLATEFCTYFGGYGGSAIYGMQLDRDGNMYLRGITEGLTFPCSAPGQHPGTVKTYLAKLACDGKTMLFCTYLSCVDTACVLWPTGLSIGPDNSVVLCGMTSCTCLPVTPDAMYPVARDTVYPQDPALSTAPFLMKFSESGQLLYCSYLDPLRMSKHGGNWWGGCSVAHDASGCVYLAGGTDHDLATRSPRAFQKTFDRSTTFLMKLAPGCDSVIYCTYYGSDVIAWSIRVDAGGQAIIGGQTWNDYIGTVPLKNAQQPVRHPGSYQAFLAAFNSDGSDLLFSTYVGGKGMTLQDCEGLALDPDGNIAGLYTTTSLGMATPGAYKTQASCTPADSGRLREKGDLYIAKFGRDGSLLRATYLGGAAWDGGGSLAVDRLGRVFVLCTTASKDYPLINPYDTMITIPKYGISMFDGTLSMLQWSTLWSHAFDSWYSAGWGWGGGWGGGLGGHSCRVDSNLYLSVAGTVRQSQEQERIFHAGQSERFGNDAGFIARFFMPDSTTMRIPAAIDAADTVRINRAQGIASPLLIDVRARFRNVYDRDAVGARAEIVLPRGFRCTPDPLDTMRTVGSGTIPANQSVELSWLVLADTSLLRPGTYRIAVNVYYNDSKWLLSCPQLATQSLTDIVVVVDGGWKGEMACSLDAADTLAAPAHAASIETQALFAVRNTGTRPQPADGLALRLPRGMGVTVVPASDTLAAGRTLAPGEGLSKPWTLRASVRPTTRRIGLEARAQDARGNMLAVCAREIVCPGRPELDCATEGPDSLRLLPGATDSLRVTCRLENPLDSAQALREVAIDLSAAPHLALHAGQAPVQGPFPLAARFRRVVEWELDAIPPAQASSSDTIRFLYRTDASTGHCAHVVVLRRLRSVLVCSLDAAPGDTADAGYRGEPLPLRCTVRNVGPVDWPGGQARLTIAPAGVLASAEDTLRALPAVPAGRTAEVAWTLAAPTSRVDRAYSCTVDLLDSGATTTSCSAAVALTGLRDDLACTVSAPDTLRYDVASDSYAPDPFNAVFALTNALDTARTAIDAVIDLRAAPHLTLAAGDTAARSIPVIPAHGASQVRWELAVAASAPSPLVETIAVRYRVSGEADWRSCARAILIDGGQRIIAVRCAARGHDTLWADVRYEQIIPRPLQVQYSIENTGNALLAGCSAAILPPPMYRLVYPADSIQAYGTIPPGGIVAREWLLEIDPAQARFGTAAFAWAAGCTGPAIDSACLHAVTLMQGSPPGIVLSPWLLRFRAVKDGPPPASQSVSLWPGGGLSMPWLLLPEAAWVDVQPSAGTQAATVSIHPTTTSLADGTHATRIDVASQAMVAPQGIDVTYELTITNAAERPAGAAYDLRIEVPSPHPAHGTVTLAFTVRQPGHVLLAAYDALGRRVSTIADNERRTGRHQVAWNTTGLPPGIYLLTLQENDNVAARRVAVR